MGFEQVVVTLTPVYSPDTLPFRSLTFSSNDDTVPIGRASKSEVKNLVPDHDNGWFNSRVMSRNHAVLGVYMDKQAVYVRDHGSLHGTQLNDNKIKPKENVTVKSGDVLTFGSEISRGTETFRPIAVRLDCQWHESKPKETAKPATNTFSVPEDEDDVVEVVDSREVHDQQKTPQNVSDSSDLGYGSDMSRPLDLTSPITSPEMKTSELPKSSSADSNQVNESRNHSALEGRPEALGNEDNEDGSQSGSEEEDDDDANSDLEDFANDQAKKLYEDDVESDDSEDDHSESNELDEQNPTTGLYNGKHFGSMGFSTSKRDDAPVPGPSQEFFLSGPRTPDAQTNLTGNIRAPTANPPGPGPANYNVPWSEYLIPRIPSPSDKAMAKPMSTPAPSYQPYSDYSSSFEIWTGNQGPSHSSYADPVNMANPYGSITANESFPFGPHRSSGYLRHLAGEFLGEEQAPAVSNEKPFELPNLRSNRESCAAVKEAEKPAEPPKTRVSIADIVEKSFTHATVSNGRKRKADDFETDLTGDSNEINGDTQDSIPDAQPRPEIQNIQISQPQLLDADPAHEVQSNLAPEHRRKRIKTKQVYSFMKYASVAAIGAVVGSIGTIAGLASLPTDFFS